MCVVGVYACGRARLSESPRGRGATARARARPEGLRATADSDTWREIERVREGAERRARRDVGCKDRSEDQAVSEGSYFLETK